MDKRLQQFLDAENISQTQLANILGVARASISHIVSGRNKPGFDFVCNFAEHFPAVSLDWLITGKGRMYRTNPAVQQSPAPQGREDAASVARSAAIEAGDLFGDSLFSDDADSGSSSGLQPAPSPAAQPVQPDCPPQPKHEPETPVEPLRDNQNLSRAISRIIVLYTDGSFNELK